MATALTPEQKAVLQTRLAAAELAYHNLCIGGQARVIVDQNGERVEFTAANSSRLAAYIADLKRQLATCSTGGPLRMIW